jgi:hypothetical protein
MLALLPPLLQAKHLTRYNVNRQPPPTFLRF